VLTRLSGGVGALLLLGGLAAVLAGVGHPTLRTATDQLGERWYRLTLDGHHVGYLHATTRRDRLGRWRFERDLRFLVSRDAPVRITESLLFGAAPPWPLLTAHQHTFRTTGSAEAALDGAQMGFTLSDHLAVETWLREDQPPPHTAAAASGVDFARGEVVTRQFRVVERNRTGYEMTHGAPHAAARIQLDHRMRPVSMSLAGLFEIERATKQLALQPPVPPPASESAIAVDQRLVDHTAIRRLVLSLRGDLQAADLWPELADGPLLRRTAGQASTAARHGDELAATALLPVGHPQMAALAARAVDGIRDPGRQAAALTRFVHEYLSYQDGVTDRSVLDLLEHPSGDCTEFADLLTTLARTLGIPSRTVFGLAYADGVSPAFRFHAWNELWVDDGWLVVDPTWNQLVVDATHIPLPADPALALQLLSGALALTFEVREIEYF
jgi:hypothetical protein